ncbi:MAG: hypothetical protein QME42_05500 [bacterium]|nr:hypothetical protein [bacterium]
MMKKLVCLCWVVAIVFITGRALGDIQQGDVDVQLEIPEIIQLELLTTNIRIIPGPEDYARNLEKDEYGGGNEWVSPGKGFADRSDAIELNMFTNAQKGGLLYVHGIQSPGRLEGVLILEDTYLAVETARTYILQNNLEGATTKFRTYPNKKTYWLRLYTEAQEIFKVTMSTKNARLIVFKLGIGNLSRYTHGNYRNTITFSLMPIVI